MKNNFSVPYRLLRPQTAQRGAVIIESAIASSIMLVIILGFAQLYSLTHYQLDHVKVATEMLMGPQERSLQYDSASRTFTRLDASSTPTLQEFMDQLGNFFSVRANSSDVLHMTMMYVQVNNATGVASGTVGTGASAQVFTYPAGASGDCIDTSIQTQLQDYGTQHITALANYTHPVLGSVETGTKLYDIMIGGTRFKEYVDFIPVVYLLMCSEPYNFLFPQLAISTFEFVPRRLVN